MSGQTVQSTHLDAAIELARAGAFVFPCRPAGDKRKQPCQGVYWRHVSTRDENKIRQWWNMFPDALPGIDLKKSGLIVIDCDRKPDRPDGVAALEKLALKHEDALDEIPTVETPTNGRHYYFVQDFEPPHGNGRGNLPPGIDVRGAGGYVIGPGCAFTDDGRAYVASHATPFDAKPMPDWLRATISQRRHEPLPATITIQPPPTSSAYGDTAIREETARVASAAPGQRNDTLNAATHSLAQLVPHILSQGEVESAMLNAALACGLSVNEARATIRSAMQAGMTKPRQPVDRPVHHVEILLSEPPQDVPAHDPETGEIADPAPYDFPPLRAGGLVDAIADWITATALYPQPALSLAAALCIVGTAAGRHMAGPNRCGTHLYVIGLAKSGAGKNWPLTAISQILTAADMRNHIGPSQFISMPAVINFLVRQPLSVCAMDEFGAFMKRINSRRASGFEGAISGLLRTAWGASFAPMATPEWAQRRSETIYSPAMSIFGASTAQEFFDSLEGGDITNGVLNRFLVVESPHRPFEQVPAPADEIPDHIVNGLKAIYYRDQIAASQLCQSAISPPYFTLKISTDAEAMRRALVAKIHAQADADPTMEAFTARTAEIALRLATIAAIGNGRVTILTSDMAFGIAFSEHCTATLARAASLYIADSDNQAAANAVRRAIQDRGGRIKRRDLLRCLGHRYKGRELDDVLKALAEAEQIVIEKLVPSGGGPPSYWYSDPSSPA